MSIPKNLLRTLLIESKGSFGIHPSVLKNKANEFYHSLKFDILDLGLTYTVRTRRAAFNKDLQYVLNKCESLSMLIDSFKEYKKVKEHVMFYISNYKNNYGMDSKKEITKKYNYIYYLESEISENKYEAIYTTNIPIKAENGSFKVFEYIDVNRNLQRYAELDMSKIGDSRYVKLNSFMSEEDVMKFYESKIEESQKNLKKTREEYIKFLSENEVK